MPYGTYTFTYAYRATYINLYTLLNKSDKYIVLMAILYVGEAMDTTSLNELCAEISQALESERAFARTLQRSSDWHHRIERREEYWEGSRQLIFENIIRNQGLPDPNVTKCIFVFMLVIYSKNFYAGLCFLWK